MKTLKILGGCVVVVALGWILLAPSDATSNGSTVEYVKQTSARPTQQAVSQAADRQAAQRKSEETTQAAEALAIMKQNCVELDETPIGKLSTADVRRLENCRKTGFVK